MAFYKFSVTENESSSLLVVLRKEQEMEQMTTRQMRDFLRAAGWYELEIDELTREARELTGDVLPHYSGWHVSGTGGRTGGSMVESAVTAAEKKRQRAACLMREVLRMKRELAFLDSLGLVWDMSNVLRLRYFFHLGWPEIARRVHLCESTCKQRECLQIAALTDAWNAAVAGKTGAGQTAAAI